MSDIGNNTNFFLFGNRSLAYNVKSSNAFYFFSKEFNSIRVVISIRKDIYNTTSNGKFSWATDKVYPLKPIFKKAFVEKI